MFVFEISLVAVLSCAGGLAVGVSANFVLARVLGQVEALRPYVMTGIRLPSMDLVGVVLLIVAVGMAVGAFLPARRAARMEPYAALRDW